MSDLYTYTGQGMQIGKSKPDVEGRIDWIVTMNAARADCLDRGDLSGLLRLADQYAAKGMKRTAKALRLEVAEKRSHE